MPFMFKKTSLEGVLVIHPQVFGDDRGFFSETYKKTDFVDEGITEEFVQDNHSKSAKGILRGLHYQVYPKAQGKLVRVVAGAVWDVAVDIRPHSPTFKQWFGITLSAENHTMLYIPAGYAHGFLSLEDNTHFLYKCTNDYSPEHEGGYRWDDPAFNVEWPFGEYGIQPEDVQVSGRDAGLPLLVEQGKEQ